MGGRALIPSTPGRRAAAVFVLTLAIYAAGLAPGVLWGDQAAIQREARTFEFSLHIRGYPLYRALTLAAAAIPLGETAWRVNLLSALAAAGAVALSYLLLERATRSRLAALLGAAALAVSHGFWTVAEIAEVYALHILLLSALACILVHPAALTGRRLLLAGGVVILGWLHHRMFAFAAPPALIVLWLRRREFTGLPGGRAWALALLVPLCLPPILLLLVDPATAAAVRAGRIGLPERLAYLTKFTVWNFPGPALLLGAAGLFVSLKRCRDPAHALLASSFLVSVGAPLVLSWQGDQHVFFLPAFLFFALLAGVGADTFLTGRPRVLALTAGAVAILPVAIYAGAATWLSTPGAPDPLQVPRPYYRSLLLPPRCGLDSPRRFAEAVLAHLPAGARLVCGWGEGNAILYLQEIDRVRPDVRTTILSGRDALHRAVTGAEGPVYLTTFPDLPDQKLLDALPEGYRAVPDGPVFRVSPE